MHCREESNEVVNVSWYLVGLVIERVDGDVTQWGGPIRVSRGLGLLYADALHGCDGWS